MALVLLDGRIIGETDKPEKLVEKIRENRRKGLISYQVNVVYYPHLEEVRILTDSGRVRRPLIIVENGKPKLTKEHIEKLKSGEIKFSDLVKEGVIEFLDAEEEENAYIALKPEDVTKEHTHLELNPGVILGLSASLIPFTEFNRGDRVNYGAKMIGQAIGMYSLNFLNRVDTKSNVLIYPQTPLVITRMNRMKNYENHSGGQNIVIAVMCYEGYNMEDAIVFNQSSIQRGLFWSMMFRTYEAEEKRYMGGQEDIIGIPEPGIRGYAGEDAYKHLPEDGIVNPETQVESDSVLIGRVSPLRFLGSMDQFITGLENIRETSIRLRHGDKGIVDRVFITESVNGNKLVKVVVRDLKVPEIGDKFASRHGQKGVIGLVIPQEEMPFSANGTIPDIIFNPHGIPSRMTIGQLIEILGGKVAALKGEKVESNPFEPVSESELRKTLEKLGFRYDGREVLYDGRTGKAFESMIFIGEGYYQKLDHLVSNKIHARSRGPITLLTKQPTEGRSKEGGLRLGEMEKDCLIAHGAALLLKERFDSDKTIVPICTNCGLPAIKDKIRGKKYCLVCGDSKIIDVEMSYAFRLMLDELKSMLIYPKIVVDEESSTVKRIEFGILSPEMIKKMSVAKITKTELYDQEGYPIEGGLMDPRLGVIDPGLRCRTCGGFIGDCQGHFGYLELTRPVLHVHYAKLIFKILKSTCRKCGKVLLSEEKRKILMKEKVTFKKVAKEVEKNCPFCGEEQKKLKFLKPTTIIEDGKILTPIQIRERLERIPDDDLLFLGIKCRPEWLVITLLPIPPVTVRPSITLETGERSEDDLTHKLVDIVRINQRLRENIELGAPDFIIEDLWELLQYHVSTYIDNEISGVPPARHRSGRILKTLSQRLKSKEGRFRGNLVGKRVNFSARSVISPDPKIDIDEVGVPEIVAKELTLPVRVNEKNIEHLKELIRNGPNKWPGANYVIRPDGRRKKITEENKEELIEELEPGYIVERHIQNGDIAVFNRQPSLHRMSMMGHRVRVMPFKTFRLNLCVCPPYNADFDGDEMNLHIPQTEEAETEAEFLMIVDKQMRSPRFSGPIVGAHKDYITGLYLLTHGNRKFSREDTVQLLRNVGWRGELPKKKEFTGKEIFSLFLPKDLTIEFKAECCYGCQKCTKEKCKYDAYVKIVDGKLITGTIDKRAVGAEKGILLDRIEYKYGPKFAKKFLFYITNLSTEIITRDGVTVSVADQDLSKEALREVKKILDETKKRVNDLIVKYKTGKLAFLAGRTLKETLETLIKTELSQSLNRIASVVDKFIPKNFTIVMAKSGARGSMVNFVQTAACIGQETIQGERIERGYVDRTFPHFKKGDISLESKGFVTHGYKQGLTPFEFFFDAMNSREGLMDKSLKTRHSGYLERRLIAALQDLKVEYDGTVRDSGNRIVQFIPGVDNLNPAKITKGGINVEEIAREIFGK